MAIQKAVEDAKKNLFRVPKYRNTITHQVLGRSGAGKVFMKPASAGTGVIAGGGVRAVLELAGIRDILTKSLGTSNPVNLVAATVAGLKSLRRPEEVAALRGKTVAEVLGLSTGSGAPATEAVGAVPGRRGRRFMSARLRITQVRSKIGTQQRHRGTLRALGLRRIGQTVEHEDSPQLQGMLRMVARLVSVEPAEWLSDARPRDPRDRPRGRPARQAVPAPGRQAPAQARGPRHRLRAPARPRAAARRASAPAPAAASAPATRAARCPSTCSRASCAAPTARCRCRWARSAPTRCRSTSGRLDVFDAGRRWSTSRRWPRKGLVKNNANRDWPVKILAQGEIDRALTVRAHAVSAAARAKIEAAGGTVELIGEAEPAE